MSTACSDDVSEGSHTGVKMTSLYQQKQEMVELESITILSIYITIEREIQSHQTCVQLVKENQLEAGNPFLRAIMNISFEEKKTLPFA